jgi:hypothetical protein
MLWHTTMGGVEGRKQRLTSLKVIDQIFGRSLNFEPTRQPASAGTGMARVGQTQPVPAPQVNPRHLPAGFSNP